MPDVSLNGIEFQIKGSSDKASNSIDSLIKNLNSLKSALAATNSAAKGTGTFKELAVSIKDFNDALKGGSERYKKFAQGLEDIAAAAELLGEKTQHISDLATSMEKLSNSKISGAAFKNLADGMAAVGFATKFISKEALDNLERMATSLSKLAGVDLKGLGSAMNAVGRGKTLEPPSPVPSEIQDVINSGDQIDLLRLKLGELQTALQSAFEKGDLTGAIRIRQQIASVEAEIRKLEEAANEVVPTMGRFREALSSIGSFLGKYAGTAKKVFSAFGKVLAFPFTRAAKDIGGYAKSIWGVVSGFKRIIGYRIVRSIIKEVTQSFGEGIQNLYGWSTMVSGRFAASMNQITTSLTYFKNSLAAAAAPIVNALAPALDFLIDKVVALINVINQLFAKLSGATSWTRAIKKAQEYDDAVSGAGGSAKEALKYLAPFDELNRLPSDNKGGGGGGADNDYSGMFEDVTEFGEGISNFADTIRKAIADGDWQGVGTLLGEKVNSIIESIDFAGLGAKVGEKINALFTTEYWTLKTINFQNIGAKIAEFLTGEDGIGGALREIDFSNIGGIIAEKLTALPEVLIGVVNNLDFSAVGKSLGDTIRGFLNGITEFIKNVDWGTTLENAIKGMFDFVEGLDIGSLAESLLTLLGSVVGAVADGLGTLLLDLADVIISPDTWTLVGAWLQDLPAKLKNAGIKAINAFGDPIVEGLNDLIDKINESGLAQALGIEVQHINFQLIPEIPQEELTKNYDAAKAKIEARSKANPTDIYSKAIISGATQAIPKAEKIIPATANFTARTDGLSKSEKSFNTKAIFTSRRNDLTASDKSFYTKAIFNSRRNDLTASDKSFYTKALFNDSSDKLTDAKKTFETTAKWSKQDYAETWEGTTWAATALWSVSKNGPDWTDADTTWNSTALFTNKAIADNLKDQYGNIEVPVTANVGAVAGAIAGVYFQTGQAKGGAFYGGDWHNIAQYAKGGLPNHGTAFVAGEAGPEIVGHVGGRTEVLNQSQLAATMYAAVRSALSGLRMTVSAPGVVSSADNAVSEETMYRAFSRALADSDLGGDIELDGDVLYSAMVNRNRRNTRLTGVNAMA